jgi:chemotaxis protein MotB
MKILPVIIALAVLWGTTSCVSYRKFEAAEEARDRYQQESDQLQRQLTKAEQSLREQTKLVDDLEHDNGNLQKDLTTEKARYDRLDETNRDLLERYDRLLAENRKLVEATSDEKSALVGQLSTQQRELDEKERALRQLENDLRSQQQNNETLEKELIAREARVNELEAAINQKEEKLRALQGTVANALRGFSDADLLQVREENGKVYVSLSQNLLFKSGSKRINAAGKEALAKLAQVLNSNTEIDITVEGHTDTDGEEAFNWDLSVTRATSVVKELVENGVDPKRVIASGRGEYFPVAPNETSAGKAQNRRTEIILTPDLDKLYEIINN